MSVTVGFEAEVYTVTESQRQVEISVVITDPSSGGAPRPFTLLLNTADNTAGMLTMQTISHALLLFCQQPLHMTMSLLQTLN